MPHLGVNAIYKAAESILKAKDFDFKAERDPLLGFPYDKCRQNERRNEYQLSS